MSYASVRTIAASQIPVIDVGPLLSADREKWRAVARALLKASSEVGFFYVSNHGVAAETIAAADKAARDFFARPLEEKLAVAINRHHHGFLRRGEAKMYDTARADLKESFVWGLETEKGDPERESNLFLGPNRWPSDMPALRPALYPFYLGMTECAKRLARAFALSLDLPEDFFVGSCRKPISRSAIIYYPPQPPDLGHEQFGVAPHTDYGCMTLLWQDEIGGLEVQGLDGEWVTAHPLPGTLVVNIGDLLARWTNDRFDLDAASGRQPARRHPPFDDPGLRSRLRHACRLCEGLPPWRDGKIPARPLRRLCSGPFRCCLRVPQGRELTGCGN